MVQYSCTSKTGHAAVEWEWGLACLGISHGPCDGTAGDGLVPLIGLRYLLLTRSGGRGLPSPAHVNEGSCLASEASCANISACTGREEEKGRERKKEDDV